VRPRIARHPFALEQLGAPDDLLARRLRGFGRADPEGTRAHDEDGASQDDGPDRAGAPGLDRPILTDFDPSDHGACPSL
jgi:hypothetical protein